MQDLTTGSVRRHLLKTTSFMLVTMVFQTLYFLVDLYWVGRLGKEAVAAVAIAGNLTFVVLAATQMLAVGTTTLVSHAAGRRDHSHAILVFNQSLVLSLLSSALFFVIAMAGRAAYVRAFSADPAAGAQASAYLGWFIPAMALQFCMVGLSASLRGIGNFKPGMIVGSATIVLNMVLAPFLIFGWVTHHAFGVRGAAIASFVAIVVGSIWLATYFFGKAAYLKFVAADWRPQPRLWGRLLKIGLPAGAEFGLMAAYLAVVYTVLRPFGAAAQAGFGIGLRIVQSGFMPVVALGFSVAPVAGQNFGGRKARRVIETFQSAVVMAIAVMAVFICICQLVPGPMVRFFSNDREVVAVGAEYLRIISWTFVGSGVVFVASSMFQAMGHTLPALVTSFSRIAIVSVPVILLARQSSFEIRWIWYLSAISVYGQMIFSLLLLRREFRRRLNFEPLEAAGVPAGTIAG